MGDQESLAPFIPQDSFLRRIARKSDAKLGMIGQRAFEPREGEPTLSFTHQDATLQGEAGLNQYWIDSALRFGDLPAICKLTFYDLTESLQPPLPPRPRKDSKDKKYGHLHCSTDLPVDEQHREKMAKLATDNGLLREHVKASKRGM